MSGSYALALIISLAGLGFIDYRFKLAFFYNRARTIKIIAICLFVFIVWDIAGILANIFFIGQNNLLLGIRIGQFPVEEIFFLVLLNYCSLVCYVCIKRFMSRPGKAGKQ